MQQPDVTVSIIVVNWNGLEHLRHCLPALACQSFRDFEVILVDNGSCDGSVNYVSQTYPAYTLLPLGENRGFDAANIAGFKVSRGRYVVLLNNDTRPRVDWLETLVEVADEQPGCGIVGSVLLRWGSDVVDTAGDGCSLAGVGFKMYSGKKYADLPATISAFGACAGAALYKRRMIEHIGFLDAEFFMNLEDVDISYRARLAGWDVQIARRSVVEHRVSPSVKKLPYLSSYYASRNIVLVWWKNTPRYLWLRALRDQFLHTSGALLLSIFVHRNFVSFARGKLAALRLIVSGRMARADIQRLATTHPHNIVTEMQRLRARAK